MEGFYNRARGFFCFCQYYSQTLSSFQQLDNQRGTPYLLDKVFVVFGIIGEGSLRHSQPLFGQYLQAAKLVSRYQNGLRFYSTENFHCFKLPYDSSAIEGYGSTDSWDDSINIV